MQVWRWVNHSGFWEIAYVYNNEKEEPEFFYLVMLSMKIFRPSEFPNIKWGPVIPEYKD